MKKFLFFVAGPGEYTILKSFAEYVQAQGHLVIFFAPDTIMDILRAEKPPLDIEIFKRNERDLFGRLKTTCEFYSIDVLVMKPSRGYMLAFERPDCLKLTVSVEDNLQFRGVGGSYRLDKVYPEWLDIFALNWPKEVHERALFHHYGITNLDGYDDLKSKVIPVGWIPSKKFNKLPSRDTYAFSYFGSGSNFNEGILPKLVEAYFKIEDERMLLSISRDVIVGNYPKLDVYTSIENYDDMLTNAHEAYLHEGYGSLIKCFTHRVPVMSFCGKSQIKQMEMKPLEDLGLIYKYDRPLFSQDIDVNELVDEIQKFREKRNEIRKNQKMYKTDGEKNLYKLIMERL